MPLPLVVLVVGIPLLVSVADRVPKLDMRPNCNSVKSNGTALNETVDSCMKSENNARDQLVKTWGQYRAADKQRCTETTTTGGPPSYVELITCLETARDARKVPAGDSLRPTRAQPSTPVTPTAK